MKEKRVARSAKKKLFLVVLGIILLIAFAAFIEFKFQLLQYDEAGGRFTDVFWINTIVGSGAMLLSFCFIFIVFLVTNIFILNNLKKFFIEEGKPVKKLPNLWLAFIIALVGAFFTKDFLAHNALVYFNSETFNMALNRDPIFGKNFGYYLFQRPFLIALTDFISGTFLAMIIYTVGYYVLAFGSVFEAIEIKSLKKNGVVLHILLNIMSFFLVKLFSYGFTAENLLFSNNGRFVGADFTQVNVWLKVYTIAPYVLAVVIILSFIFLMRSKYKAAVISILSFPGFMIVSGVLSIIVQLFWVMPYETTRQKPYIRNNMDLTRFAYNISYKLDIKDFDMTDTLTHDLMDKNKETISKLGIVEPEIVTDTVNRTQRIKNYYEFKDTDVVNYVIDGKAQALYSSARELNQKELEEKSYENLKFKYTHGYGVVVSKTNSLRTDGEPEYLVKDMPVRSIGGLPKINRPEIYFGELTKGHVITNIKSKKEVDYPERDINKQTVYSGLAGIKMSTINRIVMGVKLVDPQLIFSRNITSDSKLLINRDIIARIKLVAPFLDVDDEDAYMVISKDGRLNWIVDAYTVSNNFPYSQRTNLDPKTKINYIRNSVKVVIDAYDGTMKFYIVDAQDPVVMTNKRIYPSLFEKDRIPEDISEHIKYPTRLLKIQANILKRYHVKDETELFSGKEDWALPAGSDVEEKTSNMEPYYLLMKQADSKVMELNLMMPFISKDGAKIAGLMIARPDMYSKILLYRMPINRIISGPRQLEIDMDKEIEISKVFNFWQQGGGTILRSDVLTLPVQDEKDKGLIFIKPIYFSKGEGQLPQLKKVVAGSQGRIVMEDNIDKAIQKLLALGPYQENLPTEQSGNRALIDSLVRVYDELKAYSSSNDWENYGRKMSELDKIINEINKRKEDLY